MCWVSLYQQDLKRLSPPVDMHLIFEKSSLKNPIGKTCFLSILNLNFAGYTGRIIKFEIDKKSSSFNWIFQTGVFKIQVQIKGVWMIIESLLVISWIWELKRNFSNLLLRTYCRRHLKRFFFSFSSGGIFCFASLVRQMSGF
mgnify:CR=1 FL=1